MHEREILPGVSLAALGASERLMIGGLRLIAAGRGHCPNLTRAFENHLGSQGPAAAQGASILAHALCVESQRKLTLGWLCVRGVTWDEAAILALLEAAQRSDTPAIARWLKRVGISVPSSALQRGIAWSASAFLIAGKPFDPDVATLTTARISPGANLREQIETQMQGFASATLRRRH